MKLMKKYNEKQSTPHSLDNSEAKYQNCRKWHIISYQCLDLFYEFVDLTIQLLPTLTNIT